MSRFSHYWRDRFGKDSMDRRPRILRRLLPTSYATAQPLTSKPSAQANGEPMTTLLLAIEGREIWSGSMLRTSGERSNISIAARSTVMARNGTVENWRVMFAS